MTLPCGKTLGPGHSDFKLGGFESRHLTYPNKEIL